MADQRSPRRGKPLPGQEEDAFEPFLRNHLPIAYKFACQAFGAATARDICQEAWIELRHGWGRWPGKPIIWLYKLLLRHMVRWRAAHQRIAQEPAFPPAVSSALDRPHPAASCDELTRAYFDRATNPNLRRALDESVAAFRRAERLDRSGMIRWLSRRVRRQETTGLAMWQVARMIHLQASLTSLAQEMLSTGRREEPADLPAAQRIVAEVFAMAEVHQQGRIRITPTQFDSWLRNQVKTRAGF